MQEIILRILIMEIMTIFPLLLYTSIYEGVKNVNLKIDSISFDLCLMLSNFLLIETLGLLGNPHYIIITIIPCLVGLLKKRYCSSIIILLMLMFYFYNNYLYDSLFVIGFLFVFIILSIIYLRKLISKREFINYFCILTLILFIINAFIIGPADEESMFEYIRYMLVFYISIKVGCSIYMKTDYAYNIRKSLLEFEHDKELKNSLFKITHEIKNPIAVVKGYLDMFDIKNVAKSKKYIKIIKGEINRTLSLLTDFLLFTKVNVEKEVINFTSLILETKELILPAIKEKKLEYSFEIEKNVFISLDQNRIKQVILNLLKNAVEASSAHGYVRLKAYEYKNKLIILISDNGCGMSKETLESIKTPFYTTKQNGTGLGISLSREIIEAHGGKLMYTSTLNKGTTVKIVMPT